MRSSGLNNNKLRKQFWEQLCREKTVTEIEAALEAIHPVSAKVIRWRYQENLSVAEIKSLMQRSASTVRNYHNRGMFELQRYFSDNGICDDC